MDDTINVLRLNDKNDVVRRKSTRISRMKSLLKKNTNQSQSLMNSDELTNKVLDNPLLRYAHSYPRLYLIRMGYLLVTMELIAFMTPSIAIGIQWMTALWYV
jgi:hypothetical protein